MLIKARYLKNGTASGREYTFLSDVSVDLGDTVEIGKAQAIVTDIDVPEEEVASFRDKLKKIDKKVIDPFAFAIEASKDLNPGESKDFICPVCGGKAYAERVKLNGHLHAKCEKCGITVME